MALEKKSPMQELVGLILKAQHKCTIEVQTNRGLEDSKRGDFIGAW